jgi:hypothetical protein
MRNLNKSDIAAAEHATDFDPPIYNVWKQQTKSKGADHFGNSEVRWLDCCATGFYRAVRLLGRSHDDAVLRRQLRRKCGPQPYFIQVAPFTPRSVS